MGLKQYTLDEIVDIERKAAEGSLSAAWWCEPPGGRWSTLRYTVPPLPAGGDIADDNVLFATWAVHTRPLDRISLWCTGITNTGDATPPRTTMQLRVGYDCISTIAATRVIQPPSWQDSDTHGFLFQWSGILVTQFELWVVSDNAIAPARPTEFYFAVLVDHVGCCDPVVVDGPWVTV